MSDKTCSVWWCTEELIDGECWSDHDTFDLEEVLMNRDDGEDYEIS